MAGLNDVQKSTYTFRGGLVVDLITKRDAEQYDLYSIGYNLNTKVKMQDYKLCIISGIKNITLQNSCYDRSEYEKLQMMLKLHYLDSIKLNCENMQYEVFSDVTVANAPINSYHVQTQYPEYFLPIEDFYCGEFKVNTLKLLEFGSFTTSRIANLYLNYHKNHPTNFLSLLKNPHLKKVKFIQQEYCELDGKVYSLIALTDILNAYLEESDRNILDCQDELLDSGLKPFARLQNNNHPNKKAQLP